MSNYNELGCTGGTCPKKDGCARFLDRGSEGRPHTFMTPPFNIYNNGITTEIRCGYHEYPRKAVE